MATLFSKIISGEIPGYKIAEDDRFYAFLDINPVRPGHTLVVPKEEKDYLFDLDDETLGAMMVFARRVASAIKSVTSCRKVGVAVIGLEVNHAHIHLIPITNEGDMDFKKKQTLPEEEMKDLCTRISSAVKL